MIHKAGAGHPGGSLSAIDILVALYGTQLNFDVSDGDSPTRDRFIMSKGHAGLAVYLTLWHFKKISNKKISKYYKNGSYLSGHISHFKNIGIEISTGSLGHGLSIACGYALGNKLKKNRKNTYVLLSDGECNEGSVWEAVMFASHFKLNNLVCIIDYNNLQSLDTVKRTIDIEPLDIKFKSFGWNVKKINGHSLKEIEAVFSKKYKNNKPTCIIAKTIKGKGVSFMENKVLWHYRSPSLKEYNLAKFEINNNY